jgi:cell division protein ZapA
LKKQYNIQILGQEFSVLSDSDDQEVRNIVRYINDKVDEIGSASKISALNTALLVALNIAEELFRIKGEKESLRNGLESRSEELINYIDGKKQEEIFPLRCA